MEHYSAGSNRSNQALAMQSWLALEFAAHKELVLLAIIFGSVARLVEEPTDCDLAVVSRLPPLSFGWNQLRETLARIRLAFIAEFKIPLSIISLTQDEWIDLEDFFVEPRLPVFPIGD